MAGAWGKLEGDGRVHLLGDARHRWVNPLPTNAKTRKLVGADTAPCPDGPGRESDFLEKLGRGRYRRRIAVDDTGYRIVHIAGAGHMMHIEQPELIAPLIERFMECATEPIGDIELPFGAHPARSRPDSDSCTYEARKARACRWCSCIPPALRRDVGGAAGTDGPGPPTPRTGSAMASPTRRRGRCRSSSTRNARRMGSGARA